MLGYYLGLRCQVPIVVHLVAGRRWAQNWAQVFSTLSVRYSVAPFLPGVSTQIRPSFLGSSGGSLACRKGQRLHCVQSNGVLQIKQNTIDTDSWERSAGGFWGAL